MAEMRGTLSCKMAYDMNHDIFKVMVRSYSFYNRLADTERALATKRKRREETLTELEKAKDNVAVAQAEKEEILRHEVKTIEENRTLKTDCARLFRELDEEKKKVAELTDALKNAKSTSIANFKNTDDFQAILMLVFLEGFAHAKARFAAAFLDLDISEIDTGSSTVAQGQNMVGGGGEEHAEIEVQAEGDQQDKDIVGEANIQAENVDEVSTTANIRDKDSTAQNVV